MVSKLELGGRCTFKGTENDSAVPEAALHYVITVLWDGHWVVELLGASINLVHSLIYVSSIKLLFSITAQREGDLRILVMRSRQPQEILGKTFFFSTDNSHIIEEFSVQNCFIGDEPLRCLLIRALDWYRFEYLKLRNIVNDKVTL